MNKFLVKNLKNQVKQLLLQVHPDYFNSNQKFKIQNQNSIQKLNNLTTNLYTNTNIPLNPIKLPFYTKQSIINGKDALYSMEINPFLNNYNDIYQWTPLKIHTQKKPIQLELLFLLWGNSLLEYFTKLGVPVSDQDLKMWQGNPANISIIKKQNTRSKKLERNTSNPARFSHELESNTFTLDATLDKLNHSPTNSWQSVKPSKSTQNAHSHAQSHATLHKNENENSIPKQDFIDLKMVYYDPALSHDQIVNCSNRLQNIVQNEPGPWYISNGYTIALGVLVIPWNFEQSQLINYLEKHSKRVQEEFQARSISNL
ncbi:hypothetical protein BC833DRAFT_585825 [Globomyces pollinis-pini]|nr:hypothetical protein BC833DRAFT_585825 [Globomyces pollinis-pini]